MPTTDEHRAWANHSEEVATLLQDTYPEWAMTALFYAALHYVEAFFYAQQTAMNLPKHYDDHASRNKAVQRRMPKVWGSYQALYDDSFLARYKCYPFTTDDVRTSRDNDLEPIKQYVLNRLPKPATLNP